MSHRFLSSLQRSCGLQWHKTFCLLLHMPYYFKFCCKCQLCPLDIHSHNNSHRIQWLLYSFYWFPFWAKCASAKSTSSEEGIKKKEDGTRARCGCGGTRSKASALWPVERQARLRGFGWSNLEQGFVKTVGGPRASLRQCACACEWALCGAVSTQATTDILGPWLDSPPPPNVWHLWFGFCSFCYAFKAFVFFLLRLWRVERLQDMFYSFIYSFFFTTVCASCAPFLYFEFLYY